MNKNTQLHKQIELFVDQLERYNTKLPIQRKRPAKDYLYLRKFYTSFIDDRNSRADSIESTEYKKTLEIVKKEFPMMTLWVLCMDGRVKSIHTNGATAGIGSSIRVPGGILKEFVRGNEGKLSLIPKSHSANLLDTIFIKNDIVTEVFDSHIGCAARGGEEAARGNVPQDAGLFSDVLHKKEMAEATYDYVKTQYKGRKTISIIQTSFDPHTGYMFMGLETKKALSFVTQHFNQEFTTEALKKLTEERLVISTEELTHNTKIVELFKSHFFTIDWKDEYVKSAYTFWKNIDDMKDIALPIIEKLLQYIYPDLNSKNEFHKKCLRERGMLILTNAYNAYLHHTIDPHTSIKQENIHALHQYRYGQHEEEGIKVSEGGYPPYEISMFVLNDGNIATLPQDIELASSLVRASRRDGRINDRWNLYTNSDDFAKAPVPIVIQEIVRDERLTPTDWQELAKIDWNDLNTMSWNTMTDAQFDTYLESKAKLTQSLANAIKKIRRKLIALYDPEVATSAHLIDQYKTILGIVCDHSRRTHAIIPFMKLGLDK